MIALELQIGKGITGCLGNEKFLRVAALLSLALDLKVIRIMKVLRWEKYYLALLGTY